MYTKKISLILYAIAAIFPTTFLSQAEVKPAHLFRDHMVLQRDQAIPVWGWADPGEKITVKLHEQTKTVTTDSKGKWKLSLAAMKAGGPFSMSINRLAIKDVLIGEVWLCSGQSNMAMPVQGAENFETEKGLAKFPLIRHFKTAANASPQMAEDCGGDWVLCSPETAGRFSAAAYFFGRKLHQELNVPIGLINSSWGGTDICAWTSLPPQKKLPATAALVKIWEDKVGGENSQDHQGKFKKQMADYERKLNQYKAARKAGKVKKGAKAPRKPRMGTSMAKNQNRPANLFNGMIHPLIPYGIRGAIWYQGERNSKTIESAYLYRKQLPMMIKDWRTRWDQGDFPFITVQLPNFQSPQKEPVENTPWPLTRESMLKSLAMPNAGMAITIDTGMAKNIHPKNKQDVGKRLALWALGTTYKQDLTYSGPVYTSSKIQGEKIILSFDHVGDGLESKGNMLKGFAIAGADKTFVTAIATIEKGRVIVHNDAVKNPVAVRYAWAANPDCNLYNEAGLPASPFRTDEWDLTAK